MNTTRLLPQRQSQQNTLELSKQIIVISILVTLGHMLMLIVVLERPQVAVLFDAGLIVLFGVMAIFTHFRQMRIVKVMFIGGLWSYITFGSMMMGGIHNPIIGSYMIVIIFVALLYETHIALYMLVLSVFSIFAIFVAETNMWLPPSAIDLNATYVWMNILSNIIVITLVVYLFLNEIQKNANRLIETTTERANRREQNLSALYEVTIELTKCETLDDLFRSTVELGKSKFGIDRLGLFLFDYTTRKVVGTYGTDIHGNIRDESDIFLSLHETPLFSETLATEQRYTANEDIDLLDDTLGIVGHGWRVIIVLRDGDFILGWLSADNLLSQKPLDSVMKDLLLTYSSTLSQLMVRKQAEENRRNSEKMLQQKSDSLSAINKMADLLHSAHNLQSLLQNTSYGLKIFANAGTVLIYLVEENKSYIRLVHEVDSVIETPPLLNIDSTLSGYVIKHRTVAISKDFLDDERLGESTRKALERTNLEYLIFIPIVSGDDVLGVIILGFDKTPRLDISDYQTYAAIGQTVGLALSNIQFISAVQQEKTLSDSIIESYPNVFYMFSESGQMVRWNKNLEVTIGADTSAIQKISPPDLIKEDDRESFATLIEQTFKMGNASAYLHLINRYKQPIPYIFSTRRYEMNGMRHIMGTGVDVSDRMQLLEQLQYQTTQLRTAGEISKSIVTVLDTNELFQYTVDLISERFGYYYTGLFMIDKENEFAVLEAGSGHAGREMLRANYRLRIDNNSMIGRCIVNRDSIIASNVEIETGRFANPYLPETNSEMALPLIHRGECLGAMSVQSAVLDAFQTDDISVMRFIADHIASAVVNARLYDIIRRRQRYLGILRHVTQRAMPEHDLDTFMQTVVDTISQEFQYDFAGFFIFDYEAKQIEMSAYADKQQRKLESKHWDFDYGILGHVLNTKESYLCRDSLNDPYFKQPTSLENAPSRSVVAIPIMRYSTVIAELVIHQHGINSLSELDLEVMEELAVELALHMENIRLYDETQQNAAELERRVFARTSQLQSVNQELESFAYSVSHDLRAPLRSIDGFSQALLEDYHDKVDGTGQHFLNRIRASSQRMGQLIDDLLTLSRVTRREFKEQDVNLSKMAQEIIDLLQIHDKTRKIEVIIDAEIRAKGDSRMLRIVLENLLGNAWKFTSSTPYAQIKFTCEKQADNTIVYSVQDNGVGFQMEYAEKLFSAFQRLHSTREFDGTGIGLATVKRVIDRHGGQIWFDAEVNKGAKFYFTIGDILTES